MKNPVRSALIAGIMALLLLVVAGAWLISFYIGQERERDLLQWESRLGLVADARADAVDRLLQGEAQAVGELAGNASLQLYLWQLTQTRRAGESTADSAQRAYLRNLVVAAAERYGYARGQPVPADVPVTRTAGLVLYDADLQPVLATAGLDAAGETLQEAARGALAAARPVTELKLDARDTAVLITAVPVPAVIGAAPARGAPVGVVLGVRAAEESLYPLLRRGPSFAEDNETLLLAERDGAVLLLSPTADGGGALRRSVPMEAAARAEAAAVTSPGRFGVLNSYAGQPVLQVSRRLRSEPWIVAQQVNAAQALRESNERRFFLLVALSLLLCSVVAIAVAFWRHGSSLRAQHRAEELRDKAVRLQRQTDLLHAVTDNVDVLTLLVGQDHRVLFTNRATAEAVAVPLDELRGRALAGVFPGEFGTALEQAVATVAGAGTAVHQVADGDFAGRRRSFQVSVVPIARIGEERDLALAVLSDVTELRMAEQRHTELLRRLISTLVHAVDLHDPYSAHHATRMAEVARAVASELELTDEDRQTLDLAATLANIGKIMIPSEVLTKTDPLTGDERVLLRRHVDYALELLRGTALEGPVLDVIAQKQELLDGSGYPQGRTAEQMSMAGRILAVANAFVALVSIRAYRGRMTVEQALDELMQGAGTQYDRKVIAALFHVAENRRDWSEWR